MAEYIASICRLLLGACCHGTELYADGKCVDVVFESLRILSAKNCPKIDIIFNFYSL